MVGDGQRPHGEGGVLVVPPETIRQDTAGAGDRHAPAASTIVTWWNSDRGQSPVSGGRVPRTVHGAARIYLLTTPSCPAISGCRSLSAVMGSHAPLAGGAYPPGHLIPTSSSCGRKTSSREWLMGGPKRVREGPPGQTVDSETPGWGPGPHGGQRGGPTPGCPNDAACLQKLRDGLINIYGDLSSEPGLRPVNSGRQKGHTNIGGRRGANERPCGRPLPGGIRWILWYPASIHPGITWQP